MGTGIFKEVIVDNIVTGGQSREKVTVVRAVSTSLTLLLLLVLILNFSHSLPGSKKQLKRTEMYSHGLLLGMEPTLLARLAWSFVFFVHAHMSQKYIDKRILSLLKYYFIGF